MQEFDGLFTILAMSFLMTGVMTYLVDFFNRTSFVSAACRVNIARHYIVFLILIALVVVIRFFGAMPQLAGGGLIGIAVVLLILAILLLLLLQSAAPNLKTANKAKAQIGILTKFLKIITGNAPPVGPSGLPDYVKGLLAAGGTDDIDKGRLLEILKLLDEAKRDENFGYDLDHFAGWAAGSGWSDVLIGFFTRLKEKIDEVLEQGDLTQEEAEKIRELRQEVDDALGKLRPPTQDE